MAFRLKLDGNGASVPLCEDDFTKRSDPFKQERSRHSRSWRTYGLLMIVGFGGAMVAVASGWGRCEARHALQMTDSAAADNALTAYVLVYAFEHAAYTLDNNSGVETYTTPDSNSSRRRTAAGEVANVIANCVAADQGCSMDLQQSFARTQFGECVHIVRSLGVELRIECRESRFIRGSNANVPYSPCRREMRNPGLMCCLYYDGRDAEPRGCRRRTWLGQLFHGLNTVQIGDVSIDPSQMTE